MLALVGILNYRNVVDVLVGILNYRNVVDAA